MMIKKCIVCNKDFHSYNGIQKYCKDCLNKSPNYMYLYYRKRKEIRDKYGKNVIVPLNGFNIGNTKINLK